MPKIWEPEITHETLAPDIRIIIEITLKLTTVKLKYLEEDLILNDEL